MSKLEFVITLLAASTMPLGILYLYDKFYNYIEEENDEVPLDEEEKGVD
jgi:hypothetical protein